MGLFDKLRAELVDIVEWVDDTPRTLVWRFPRYHNQIKNGAQLIVRPGQMAVFVHQGKIADVFEPGRYTLETKNLPVLSTLAGWKYGFDSPFKAEVYFVATRQVTDLKWGTPNPVMIRDPDFGPIRVRAFGTYTLRAVDPKALLRELVGTDAIFEADEIERAAALDHRRRRSPISSRRPSSRSSISPRNQSDLAEKLRSIVVERIDDEYGLDVPAALHRERLGARGSREGDRRALVDARDRRPRGYQQYQIGAATKVAAANPAGGIAAGGIGMGMGLAMANRIGAGAGAGDPASAAAAPAAARVARRAGRPGDGPLRTSASRPSTAGTTRNSSVSSASTSASRRVGSSSTTRIVRAICA